MNEIFVKTAKAEHEVINLSNDLKRVLSYMDGKSRSGELAKRAPPSLRKKWSELLGELVEGGFIVYSHEANIDRKPVPHELDLKEISVPKPGAAAPATDLDYRRMSAAARVVAELEAAAAAEKAKSDVAAKAEAESKQKAEKAARAAELEAAAAAAAKADTEAKAEADAKQNAEKTARADELKAFFASAKEKAKAEAKQAKQEAARIRAEQEAAAAAKERSAAEAKAKTEAKQREQEAERGRAELEAAILAAKAKSDVKVKTRQEAEVEIPVAESGGKLVSTDTNLYTWRAKFGGVNASDPQRLLDLEIENAGLKKLLVDAYMEIEALKTSSGVKQ